MEVRCIVTEELSGISTDIEEIKSLMWKLGIGRWKKDEIFQIVDKRLNNIDAKLDSIAEALELRSA